MNRRSFFAALAGCAGFIAGAIKPAAAVAIDETASEKYSRLKRLYQMAPAFGSPRGTLVHQVYPSDQMLVSNGINLVPIDSDEGQDILNQSAVNLREDGSIRHRQHHWPRQ